MKYFWFGSIFGLICLIFAAVVWFQASLKPPSLVANNTTFVVNAGDPASLIIRHLKNQNLVRSFLSARLYYELQASHTVFRPGIYYLSPHQSVAQIFSALNLGPKDIKVTFPEGWRREQYAARLQATFPNFSADEFLKITATLEGQLYPDTYYLPASPSSQKIVSILTTNFVKKSGLSPIQKDLLVIASLVERESNNPKDSGLIAGIITKRLRHNWPLQLDATVQYAKDTQHCRTQILTCDYWQPIYDTKFESLYNTYLHLGLPPGPISNPGSNSLNAALNPVDSEYWYYLTGNDGQTYFSKDLPTHQKLIDTYLKH